MHITTEIQLIFMRKVYRLTEQTIVKTLERFQMLFIMNMVMRLMEIDTIVELVCGMVL